EEAVEWADALNVLRLQLERMQGGFIPSLREYNRVFGVTRERIARSPRRLVILHPGPIKRCVEIDSDVADGPHSVILDQVTTGVVALGRRSVMVDRVLDGVPVRMAVLFQLAGGVMERVAAAMCDSELGESRVG